VIVVDDAAPRGQARQVASAFAGVTVIRRHKQGGFAAAANTGIRASSGAVVQLLNGDAEVTAGWAAAALRWFEDPKVGAVAPLVLAWPDGRIIDSAGDRYYLGGVAAKRGHGKPLSDEFAQPCEVWGASASSAFYRRRALIEAGLFPESFGSYFEDVDLSFRLQTLGYRIMYEPACRVLHRIGASHPRRSRRLIAQQSRNEERVFWRNVPGQLLPRAIVKHLAVLLGKSWRRWREGTLSAWLAGRLRVLGEIAEVAAHRRDWARRSQQPMLETRWGP
jgi:GT2 family glycosyltransferase